MIRSPRPSHFLAALLCMALANAQSLAAPAATWGIPLRPDPPIAVDGDLGEWAAIPNAAQVNTKEQVIWGAGGWDSLEDMHATIHLAWRQEYLFIATQVVDDQLCQSQRGANIWKGDHVEVYIDAQPDLDPNRQTFGEGQFQILFSPGNFVRTGDSFSDCPPEAYCFRPEGLVPEGVLVAAQPTPTGWNLEAAIPWLLLGVTPSKGTFLGIEVALSDTDSSEARQESMMTTSTEPWHHQRSRLNPAALAGSDGLAPARASKIPIFEDLTLQGAEKKVYTFEAPAVPEGRQGVLSFEARLHSSKVAGFTQGMRIVVNGKGVSGDRFLNKPLRAKSRGGKVYTLYAGDRLVTYYTPNFQAPNIDSHYGLLDGILPCLFELDVTDLLQEGANTLEFQRVAREGIDNPLIAEGASVAFRLPPPPEVAKAGPPTGLIPVIEPRKELKATFAAKQLPDSRIELSFMGETLVVESRFSTPKPGWVRGSSTYFRYERRIETKPEGVMVYDTLTNLTDAPLGLMHRHEVALGDQLKGLWLAGLKQTTGSGKSADAANPTTFGATDRLGLGLVASDDVTRTHVANYAHDGMICIADNNLVLAPRASHTAEWLIIPVEKPDYWRFINTARRFTGANFLIDGGFAFFRHGPLTDPWTDQQVKDFLTFKDAHYACASIGSPKYKGRYSHGTAFQLVSHDTYRKSLDRWRALHPETQYLVYFHCFLDVTDDGPERFADARTLRPDGGQADYGKVHQRLYCPTETNSYGAAVAKNVDIILDKIGADGVYWDEHEYSRSAYHFGEPWDGVSGDIDPKTMKVTRLKSSITLLSEAWRLALAKRIQAHGPLVGNGAARTRAMVALQFPCFIETGSITNCTRGHLYSPIALGDHLTERSEQDAYGTMLAALDYGCVYHWYNDLLVIPTHHHLTRYMYPITPMELHEGYIIGQERIITKKSGLYGWGGDATHEVHVFNADSVEVEGFDAPLVTRDGKTYTELRIGEDWSAAIIRK
jgi:cellulose/xylan binding protein with CBM9 domain